MKVNKRIFAQGLSNYIKHNPKKIIEYSIKISETYIDILHLETLSNPIKIRNVLASVSCAAIIVNDLNIVPKIMSNTSLVQDTINSVLNNKIKFLDNFASVLMVKRFINELRDSVLDPSFIAIAVTTFDSQIYYDALFDVHNHYFSEGNQHESK